MPPSGSILAGHKQPLQKPISETIAKAVTEGFQPGHVTHLWKLKKKKKKPGWRKTHLSLASPPCPWDEHPEGTKLMKSRGSSWEAAASELPQPSFHTSLSSASFLPWVPCPGLSDGRTHLCHFLCRGSSQAPLPILSLRVCAIQRWLPWARRLVPESLQPHQWASPWCGLVSMHEPLHSHLTFSICNMGGDKSPSPQRAVGGMRGV